MALLASAVLAILAAATHIVLAVAFWSQANAYDERDRLVVLRSERIAGDVLAAGVFAGIGLAMAQVDRFWIAQALIAALVLAEITDGIIKVVLYRLRAGWVSRWVRRHPCSVIATSFPSKGTCRGSTARPPGSTATR